MDTANKAYVISQLLDTLTDKGCSVNLHGVDYKVFEKLKDAGWSVGTGELNGNEYYTASKGQCTLFSTNIEKEPTELTFEEIAEKFNTPVEDVRIKD